MVLQKNLVFIYEEHYSKEKHACSEVPFSTQWVTAWSWHSANAVFYSPPWSHQTVIHPISFKNKLHLKLWIILLDVSIISS